MESVETHSMNFVHGINLYNKAQQIHSSAYLLWAKYCDRWAEMYMLYKHFVFCSETLRYLSSVIFKLTFLSPKVYTELGNMLLWTLLSEKRKNSYEICLLLNERWRMEDWYVWWLNSYATVSSAVLTRDIYGHQILSTLISKYRVHILSEVGELIFQVQGFSIDASNTDKFCCIMWFDQWWNFL
jgi:hypothetical protein